MIMKDFVKIFLHHIVQKNKMFIQNQVESKSQTIHTAL